jgi:hypothetical protein
MPGFADLQHWQVSVALAEIVGNKKAGRRARKREDSRTPSAPASLFLVTPSLPSLTNWPYLSRVVGTARVAT